MICVYHSLGFSIGIFVVLKCHVHPWCMSIEIKLHIISVLMHTVTCFKNNICAFSVNKSKYTFHIHIGLKVYSWGNRSFNVIAIAFESAVLQNKILLYRLLFLKMRDSIDVLMMLVIKQVIFLQMTVMEESWILLK